MVENGRLVVNTIDQVGNELTHTLMWCEEHHQPVWLYGDGSFVCWWEDRTGHRQNLTGWGCGPEFHTVVDLPLMVPEGPAHRPPSASTR
jgi:hypothetical protein